jgi:hypothetical protein
LWLKNGAVNTKAPSTVPGHEDSANVLTVLDATKTKMNNWTSCLSWDLSAPKTVQATVLDMPGADAREQCPIVVAPVSTKVLHCRQQENRNESQ